MNIYKKQMNSLGLNVKQYSELINIPYEVVKSFIYEKEGDYEVGLKDLLRRNMLEKHQKIEQNYENAKIRAMEIKNNENGIDYLSWYENDYTPQMLKKTLNVSTISEFVRKYDLKKDGVKFSNWVYQLLSNKREYEGHHIEPSKKLEFIKQLYDIVENKNTEKYRADKIVFEGVSKNTQELYDWYKSFDFAEFRKKYGISNGEIANDLRISYSTMGHLATNDYFCTSLIRRFYNYVNSMDEYEDLQNEKQVMLDWFKSFDFKKYFKKNKISQYDFANLCDVSYQTLNRIINQPEKQNTLTNSIRKIYNFVNKKNTEYDEDILEDYENEAEIEENVENSATLDNSVNESQDISTPRIVLDDEKTDTSNEMLRKILASRLTDEEKELIRIFGGNI